MAESKPKQPWMVNLSTFVVVCGSLAFGSCPGYSSPAQAAIRNDLFLTIAEAMRVSSAFCVVVALDLGRLATGYGMGAFSYAGAKAYIFAGDWTFVGVLPHIESKKEQEENSIKSKSLEAVIKKDLPEVLHTLKLDQNPSLLHEIF
ncbi:hypothetical protein HID58_014099 [Brassica napus]|uniref:Uncharacterized protein n=1 Tax=Brassica napus TaxID=3708 RepID=A0ABQ8DH67_BRANA|nr:hypothetical protein HID58_014099 [Brassica napus]